MRTYINHITKRINKFKVARRTMKELNSLSDRDLMDIGISRSDIPFIANNV
jgi:uncharacterized protein YjiS (DUF1127 family)